MKGISKDSLLTFFISYIEFVMILLLIYLVLGPSENTSFPLLMALGLPITAIMFFTGWDKKLKKHLP